MTQPPRDWDRELSDVDKAIERDGGETALPPARGVPAERGSAALPWFLALLAVALAVALAVWPYERDCGLRLGFFLGATGLTLLAGFMGATASWAGRRGVAHLLSLLVLGWAGVVAAREVLPRIGYAREARTWFCTEPVPPAAPPPASPAPEPQPPAAQPPAAQPPSAEPGAPVN